MASIDRIAMFVMRVISSGLSRKATGATTITASTKSSTNGSTRNGSFRMLPALVAGSCALTLAIEGACTTSAFLRINHGGLA
jgi:hypothetical protein